MSGSGVNDYLQRGASCGRMQVALVQLSVKVSEPVLDIRNIFLCL